MLNEHQIELAICYMPLDANTFSSLLSAVHDIQMSWPFLNKHLIIWRHYLVSSTLDTAQDTWTLYDYLSHPETGKVDDGLINQVKDKAQVRLLI